EEVAASFGPMPLPLACDYVRQAALGLHHAFERQMVHRDIKPHNLMRTPEGQVKILDFGLARFVSETMPVALAGEPRPGAGTATATGGAMGTADYMAPEEARDAHRADIRADIYSLGCTLYRFLTGQVPFPGGTLEDKLRRHRERLPDPAGELRPDLPPRLARLLERLLAKDPA